MFLALKTKVLTILQSQDVNIAFSISDTQTFIRPKMLLFKGNYKL